nr:MAG TPA: hypothetical protein [Bacteriophage sp.]
MLYQYKLYYLSYLIFYTLRTLYVPPNKLCM